MKDRLVYHAPGRCAADTSAERFVKHFSDEHPALVRSFVEDLDSYRRCIRTANLIERAFVEEKRRMRIISGTSIRGAFQPVYGVLIRVSQRQPGARSAKPAFLARGVSFRLAV